MAKDYPYKEVGNRLKILRDMNKLSQPQFATLLGISLRSYQRYEHGERLPGLKILPKVSEITLADATWVISGYDRKDISSYEDDLSEAIDKIDFLFSRGSFALIDFFIKILNIAISVARSGFDTEEGEDLVDFLMKVSDISSSAVRKAFDERGKISYKYRKNRKTVSVSYKTKNKETKNKSSPI